MNTALFIYRWCFKTCIEFKDALVCVWFYMVTFCRVAQCSAKSLAVLDISLYVVSISWWHNCTVHVGIHLFLINLCQEFFHLHSSKQQFGSKKVWAHHNDEHFFLLKTNFEFLQMFESSMLFIYISWFLKIYTIHLLTAKLYHTINFLPHKSAVFYLILIILWIDIFKSAIALYSIDNIN